MTIIFMLIIIFCFTILGYKMASYYINRKKFFSGLQILLSGIEADVTFTQDKLKYVIQRNSNAISSKELNLMCNMIFETLDKKQKIQSDLFEDIKILKKEEKELLLKIFGNLGRFDVVSLGIELKTYQNKVKEKCNESNEECKKYAGLFIKLGIIVGLLVCLLII